MGRHFQRIHAVQNYTGGTGAGEGRGNFLTDIARLADADDDNFPALAKGLDD